MLEPGCCEIVFDELAWLAWLAVLTASHHWESVEGRFGAGRYLALSGLSGARPSPMLLLAWVFDGPSLR